MNAPRRALILAGGGLKVAAQAGVLQVWLDEAGIEFDHADGCSGGTLNLAMYCAGLSGSDIAQNWRGYRPLRTLGLNTPGFLAGPLGPSLFTLDKMRDRQLPAWGVDWDALTSTSRSATFNLYDFTAHRLVTLTPSQLTPDRLMACVALPGWFPPVRDEGSELIDSVYATDANLAEAIARGADELWVVWTVNRSGRWRPGWLAAYFQVIEASANSRLADSLRLVEENNAEVAAGRTGAYGQHVSVRMLQLDVPLHYLLVFRRRQVAAAVELGVSGARAWCAQEGLSLRPPPAAAPVARVSELRFSETMSGPVRFTASSTAAAGGLLREHELTLRLKVAVPDLDELLRDPRHRASLTGKVQCQALGGDLPVTSGSLDVLAVEPGGTTMMRYSITCIDAAGRDLLVEGYKTLRHDAELDLWADTTTLTTTVTGPEGSRLAEGTVRLTLTGFFRLLLSFRGRTRGAASLAPGLRFGGFFLGRLARIYLARRSTTMSKADA